ncbi:MAG: hypothetical protein DWB42_09660 [Chloroflexi bacterium]|nr:hypothetical protein [Chloroflexota bacterium]
MQLSHTERGQKAAPEYILFDCRRGQQLVGGGVFFPLGTRYTRRDGYGYGRAPGAGFKQTFHIIQQLTHAVTQVIPYRTLLLSHAVFTFLTPVAG